MRKLFSDAGCVTQDLTIAQHTAYPIFVDPTLQSQLLLEPGNTIGALQIDFNQFFHVPG